MKKIDGSKLIKEFDIIETQNSIGKDIEISACVHKVRKMSEFAFVILRTGRYLIQTIYSSDNCSDSLDDVKEGCYVKIMVMLKKIKGPIMV